MGAQFDRECLAIMFYDTAKVEADSDDDWDTDPDFTNTENIEKGKGATDEVVVEMQKRVGARPTNYRPGVRTHDTHV